MSIALPPLLQGQKELERLWNAGQNNFLPRSLTVKLIALKIIELIATKQLPIPDQSACLLGAARVYAKLSSRLHRDVKYANDQLFNTDVMRKNLASRIQKLDLLDGQSGSKKYDSMSASRVDLQLPKNKNGKKLSKKQLALLAAQEQDLQQQDKLQQQHQLQQQQQPFDDQYRQFDPFQTAGEFDQDILDHFDLHQYQPGFDLTNTSHQDELFNAMNQLAQAGDDELTHIYTSLQRYAQPYTEEQQTTPGRHLQQQHPQQHSLSRSKFSTHTESGRIQPTIHEDAEFSDIPLDSDDLFEHPQQNRSYYAQSRYSLGQHDHFDSPFHQLDQSNASVIVRDHHADQLYHQQQQSPLGLELGDMNEFDLGFPTTAKSFDAFDASDFSLGFDIDDLSSYDQDEALRKQKESKMATLAERDAVAAAAAADVAAQTGLDPSTIFAPQEAPFQELREFFFTFNVQDNVLDQSMSEFTFLDSATKKGPKKSSLSQPRVLGQDGMGDITTTPSRRKKATIVGKDGKVVDLSSLVKKKQIASQRKVHPSDLDQTISLPVPHLTISHLPSPSVQHTPYKLHSEQNDQTGSEFDLSSFSFSTHGTTATTASSFGDLNAHFDDDDDDDDNVSQLRVHFDLGAQFSNTPATRSNRQSIRGGAQVGEYGMDFDDFDEYGNDDFGMYGDNGFTIQIRDLQRPPQQQPTTVSRHGLVTTPIEEIEENDSKFTTSTHFSPSKDRFNEENDFDMSFNTSSIGLSERTITKHHENFLHNNAFSNPSLFSPLKSITTSQLHKGDKDEIGFGFDFDDLNLGDLDLDTSQSKVKFNDDVEEKFTQITVPPQQYNLLLDENFDFSFISNQSLLLSNIVTPSTINLTPGRYIGTKGDQTIDGTDSLAGTGFDDEIFFPTLHASLNNTHDHVTTHQAGSTMHDTSFESNFSIPASLGGFSTGSIFGQASRVSAFSNKHTNQQIFDSMVHEYQNLAQADLGSVPLDGTAQHKLHQVMSLQDRLTHDFTSTLPSITLHTQHALTSSSKPRQTQKRGNTKNKNQQLKKEDRTGDNDDDEDLFDVELSSDDNSHLSKSSKPKPHSTFKRQKIGTLYDDSASESENDNENDQTDMEIAQNEQTDAFLMDLFAEIQEHSIDLSISSLSNVFSSYFRINPPHLPSFQTISDQHLQELQYHEFVTMLNDLDTIHTTIEHQNNLVAQIEDLHDINDTSDENLNQNVSKLKQLQHTELTMKKKFQEYSRNAAHLSFDKDGFNALSPTPSPLLSTQITSGIAQFISKNHASELLVAKLGTISAQNKPILKPPRKKYRTAANDFFFQFVDILADNGSPYHHQVLDNFHNLIGADGKYDITLDLNPMNQQHLQTDQNSTESDKIAQDLENLFNFSFSSNNSAMSIRSNASMGSNYSTTQSAKSTLSNNRTGQVQAPQMKPATNNDFQVHYENSFTLYQSELLSILPTSLHEVPFAESTLNQSLVDNFQYQLDVRTQSNHDDITALKDYLQKYKEYQKWLQTKSTMSDEDSNPNDDEDLFSESESSDNDSNNEDNDGIKRSIKKSKRASKKDKGSKKTTKKTKKTKKSSQFAHMDEPHYMPTTLRATVDMSIGRLIESMQNNEYRTTKLQAVHRKQQIALELWRLHQFAIFCRLPIYTQPLIIQHYIDMGVFGDVDGFTVPNTLVSDDPQQDYNLSSQYHKLQREIDEKQSQGIGDEVNQGFGEYDQDHGQSFMDSFLLQNDQDIDDVDSYNQLNQSIYALQQLHDQQQFQHQLDGDMAFDFNLSSTDDAVQSEHGLDVVEVLADLIANDFDNDLTPTRFSSEEGSFGTDNALNISSTHGSTIKRSLGTTMSGVDFTRLDTSLQHDLTNLHPIGLDFNQYDVNDEEHGDLWASQESLSGTDHDVRVRDAHGQPRDINLSRDSLGSFKASDESMLGFHPGTDQLISNESYMGDLYSDDSLDLTRSPSILQFHTSIITPTSSFTMKDGTTSPTQLQSLSDTIHDLHHWAREQDELRSPLSTTTSPAADVISPRGFFEKTLSVLGYDSKYVLHLIIQLYKETQQMYCDQHNTTTSPPTLCITLTDLISRRRQSILAFYQQYNKNTAKVTERRVASSTFFLLLHLVKHGVIHVKQTRTYDTMSISLQPL